MKKPGKVHCVACINSTGEQVKVRRNLAHWGSLDTVSMQPQGSGS